jgi:Ricin-type beta-trefoil lectin domain
MHESKLMGGVHRALVMVGAVFGVAALSAGEARADGPVQLRSRLGDFCLDTPTGNMFTPTVINPCNGTDFQRWNLTAAGQLESVAFPGACLSQPGESWWVHVQPCVDWFTQQWTIQPNGQVTTTFGACLTVLGGPGPGTNVSTRFCTGAPDQAWDSVP